MSIIHQLFRTPGRYRLNTKTLRFVSSKGKTDLPSTSATSNVSGLSSKVLKVPSGEVGPGASKSAKYKNPEDFSYHQTSYFEAELEMLKFRLPLQQQKVY